MWILSQTEAHGVPSGAWAGGTKSSWGIFPAGDFWRRTIQPQRSTCLCHNTIRVCVHRNNNSYQREGQKNKEHSTYNTRGGGWRGPAHPWRCRCCQQRPPPTVSGSEWVGVWVVHRETQQPEVNREKPSWHCYLCLLLPRDENALKTQHCSLNTPVYFSVAQTGELGLISEATAACLSQRVSLKHGFDLNVTAASCSSVHRLLYWFPSSHRAECWETRMANTVFSVRNVLHRILLL